MSGKRKWEIGDTLMVLGMGFTFTGLWMVYVPAAFIAVGILFVVAGVRMD